VDRVVALAEAPSARQEGDTLIIPVLEEVLVVEKRVRIKEEIHVTRTAREEPYRATVALRSEQVAVERLAPGAPADATSPNGGTHHATHTVSRV
jgi:stress response protein YsnF